MTRQLTGRCHGHPLSWWLCIVTSVCCHDHPLSWAPIFTAVLRPPKRKQLKEACLVGLDNAAVHHFDGLKVECARQGVSQACAYCSALTQLQPCT